MRFILAFILSVSGSSAFAQEVSTECQNALYRFIQYLEPQMPSNYKKSIDDIKRTGVNPVTLGGHGATFGVLGRFKCAQQQFIHDYYDKTEGKKIAHERLEKHKSDFGITACSGLDLTPTGKVNRREVRCNLKVPRAPANKATLNEPLQLNSPSGPGKSSGPPAKSKSPPSQKTLSAN